MNSLTSSGFYKHQTQEDLALLLREIEIEEQKRKIDATRALNSQSVEAVRERCAGSLIEFARAAWHILEPQTRYIHGWHLDAIAEHLEAVTDGRLNRLLVNVPPGSMKALEDSTPVLTTVGWRSHGELLPGDFVFGIDGKPKKVLAATQSVMEPSYEVTFDDGETIVAGTAHEWVIERAHALGRRDRRPKHLIDQSIVRKGKIVETRDLKSKAVTKWPDRIAVCDALESPHADLDVDPWFFGAWLGDGDSADGCVYASAQDVGHFSVGRTVKLCGRAGEHGRKQDFYRVTQDGFRRGLRRLGVLGKKAIPPSFLRSSMWQRISILQGVMDTDGYVENGRCGLTLKSESLIRGVREIVHSLGVKTQLRSRTQPYRGQLRVYWELEFNPDFVPFRLPRKATMVSRQIERSKYRYIRKVTHVGDRLVKCIQVEGSIYLAGENLTPTHNSLMISSLWPAWEWGPKGLSSYRYISTSFKEDAVLRDNRRMRDLVTSDWYQMHWPMGMKRMGEVSFENVFTGWREGVAFGSLTSKRGDRLIIDDPHSVEKAESKVDRERAAARFREGAFNRLNDQEKSAIVVVMQRINEGDISGVILDGNMGYEHVCIPMEYEASRHCTTSIGFSDPRIIEGELLCEEKWSAETIAQMKNDTTPYTWAGQYQQRPAPRGGGIFPYASWEYWDKSLALKFGRNESQFPDFDLIIASVDGAFTEKQSNDLTAMVVLGLWTDLYGFSAVMVMDFWQDRLQFGACVERIVKTTRKKRVDRLLIENKGPGIPIGQEIRRLTMDEGFQLQLINPGNEDKEARANAISVFHREERENGETKEGLVYVPVQTQPNGQVWPRQWADLLMSQCASFPKGKHDDGVDAYVQGMRWLRQRGLLRRKQEEQLAREDERMMQPQRPVSLYPGM